MHQDMNKVRPTKYSYTHPANHIQNHNLIFQDSDKNAADSKS